VLWDAYEALDAAHVRHTPTHPTTDLVSVLRYTLGIDDELVPYVEEVRERYRRWLDHQTQSGVTFSPVEQWWLDRIVEVIASSAGITVNDLDDAPFTARGGLDGAQRDAMKVVALVDALSAELTA
jgi:type I restriction enzyme R subunit